MGSLNICVTELAAAIGVKFIGHGGKMTDRYALLIASIHASDLLITRSFLYAFFAVIAYPILNWTPGWMRRPMQYLYLGSLLAAFIFITVFSWPS